MSGRACRWAIASGVLAVALPAIAAGQDRFSPAPAIELEVERIAALGPLWPGFDPLKVPLAIYDGTTTWLFRHPRPPAGFARLAGSIPPAWTSAGRFPAVTANTSADIGGVPTATLLADRSRDSLSVPGLAAVAIHEAFHVFQRTHHPTWAGNEGDLLEYPVDNAELLALRRMESEALARALANQEAAGAACWTRAALAARRQRFGGMDSAFVAYERLTELNEGLAAYLQLRAAGASTVAIPAEEFLPESVRLRIYTIGPALAFLLDRLSPGWQQQLESGSPAGLDQLLEAAVASSDTVAPCAFTPVEEADAKRHARLDAAALKAEWARRTRDFDALPGWRVVVQSAKGKPLWPQGFDPLNIERAEGGLVHTRFLKLGNDGGQLTMVDEAGADLEARTVPVGPHPLFNGIDWVEVVLPVKPVVTRTGTAVHISAPGFTADFKAAEVMDGGQQVLVQLR